MSGKIGYRGGGARGSGSISLNPFYVREDWLRHTDCPIRLLIGLNPFYVREDWLLNQMIERRDLARLNPFYVREDWLQIDQLKHQIQ